MQMKPASIYDIEEIYNIEKNTNTHPWSKENFESSINAGNGSLIFKIEGNIVGYAFFSIAGSDSQLLNITVSKDHQKKGFGKKILEKFIYQSKVLGATVIFLEVRVSNELAISFYEKYGFKRDAIRYNYYNGNPKEDALLMSKQGL